MVKIINKNLIYILLFILIFLMIVSITIQFIPILNECKTSDNVAVNFSLLAPSISFLDHNQFIERKQSLETSYKPLRKVISNIISDSSNNASIGFYFEDLTTGAWIGIDEKERFLPGSLMKISIVVSTLKKVENNELKLDSYITVLPEDLDSNYGPLFNRGYGYNMTVFELINYTLHYSDNTAERVLKRINNKTFTVDEDLVLGISLNTLITYSQKHVYYVSPKEYSNVFRSLYYSNYLNRISSELLLTLLTDTNSTIGLASTIPNHIKVAHKIGDINVEGIGEFHNDCGIVYVPENPYLLCVLIKDLSKNEAEELINYISKEVYKYINS